MTTCEICGAVIMRKLAPTHDSDEHYCVNFFGAQESGEVGRSVPRNFYCSPECAIEGLKEDQPRQATEEQWRRREELMSDE